MPFKTGADAAGLRGLASRAMAHFLSSKAHGEHHTRGNVSFSDGFGSSNICDTVMKTRWDLVGIRERRRVREPSAPAATADTH